MHKKTATHKTHSHLMMMWILKIIVSYPCMRWWHQTGGGKQVKERKVLGLRWKCSVWYMWMPYCLGGSEEVVEQVNWGAAVTVLSASTRGVCRKNVRGNTTAGKVATMNACANSRHLQNSWKSCLWALFCHLGGGCQSQTGFEQQNIHQVKFWYWGISKFLNLNVLRHWRESKK